MISPLIVSLLLDPELRAEWELDPIKILDRFKVSDAERTFLQTKSMPEIEAAVQLEVSRALQRLGDVTILSWQAGGLAIAQASVQGSAPNVTVFFEGAYFPLGLYGSVDFSMGGGVRVRGQIVQVDGSYKASSRMIVRAVFPSPGEYTAEIVDRMRRVSDTILVQVP